MTKSKTTKTVTQPDGFPVGLTHTRIAVTFKSDLFATIKARAIKENVKFSDMVSELCKVGILDLDDSDRHEPRGKPMLIDLTENN